MTYNNCVLGKFWHKGLLSTDGMWGISLHLSKGNWDRTHHWHTCEMAAERLRWAQPTKNYGATLAFLHMIRNTNAVTGAILRSPLPFVKNTYKACTAGPPAVLLHASWTSHCTMHNPSLMITKHAQMVNALGTSYKGALSETGTWKCWVHIWHPSCIASSSGCGLPYAVARTYYWSLQIYCICSLTSLCLNHEKSVVLCHQASWKLSKPSGMYNQKRSCILRKPSQSNHTL